MKAQFIRGALAFALLISVAGVPQSGVSRSRVMSRSMLKS